MSSDARVPFRLDVAGAVCRRNPAVLSFRGAALLIAIPLQQFSWADRHEGELVTGMIFLAGGLAFLIYYVMVSKQEMKESA